MFLKKSLILIIFLSIVAVSCNSGEKESDDSEKATISFMHFWSEPGHQKAIDSLISDFEREYDCTVETSLLSWNDGKMKLTAAFNSKTAPDVLELGSDWTAQFADAGVLYQFEEGDIAFTRFLDFSLIPAHRNDAFYCVPWSVATRALFCNTDLLEASDYAGAKHCPQNYEELKAMAAAINAGGTAKGIGMNSSDAHRLYKKILPMFFTYGGRIFDDSGKLVLFSSENTEALEMYCSLAREGFIETQRQIDASFAKGKTGFCISGQWLRDKIENENPEMNYKVCLMPSAGDKPGISFAGGEYLGINKNSDNIALAKSFIKYLTNGENALKFCLAVPPAGFPADKEYYKDKRLTEVKYNEIFAMQLESARMTPMHPKWLDIEAVIEEATVEALYGKKSPEDALYDANEKIKLIIDN